MAQLRGTISEVLSRLVALVRRVPRAVVAIGVIPPSLKEELPQKLSAHGIATGDYEWCHLDNSDSAMSRLSQLNRQRDLLLKSSRLVLLTAENEAGLRQLRRGSVDLSSAPDLGFVVVPEVVPGDLPILRAALGRRTREQDGVIDLTGLLPPDAGMARIDAKQVYMPLVGLRKDRDDRSPLPRLCIVAQPGAGKTTFLRRLGQSYLSTTEDPLVVGLRVPVLVPLAAWARAREQRQAGLGFWDFLSEFLAERGVESAHAIQMLAPELLLLLDGLDEVRGADQRKAMLEDLLALPIQGGPAMVITTRTAVFDEWTETQRSGFHIVSIRAPGYVDTRNFLRRFFGARGTEEPNRHAFEVVNRLQQDPGLNALARSPLVLVFLALLHELEGRIPEHRSQVYRRIGEILLDRWERLRARSSLPTGTAPPRPALGDTRRVVGAFAWWMIDSGYDEVTRDELEAEFRRIEVARGATPADAAARASALVALAESDSAVFVCSGPSRFRFLHATLVEYFAGVEMARGGDRYRKVITDPFNPDWKEILVFCAGELGQRGDERLEDLGRSLLQRRQQGGRYGANHAAVIADVLKEDPGFSISLLRELVERLVELCCKQKYFPRSRPLIASILRETARIARQRSWLTLFREELIAWCNWRQFWTKEQEYLAEYIGLIYIDLGVDPAGIHDRLVRDPAEELRRAGWRSRIACAEPDQKEALVAAALVAEPGWSRFSLLGEFDSVGDDDIPF